MIILIWYVMFPDSDDEMVNKKIISSSSSSTKYAVSKK